MRKYFEKNFHLIFVIAILFFSFSLDTSVPLYTNAMICNEQKPISLAKHHTYFLKDNHLNPNELIIDKSLSNEIQSSEIFIEKIDEFNEGIMENLSITDQGYISLEKNIYSNYWRKITSNNVPQLIGFDMIYDSQNGVVVVFGGMNSSGQYQNDTWTYNFEVNTWTKQNPFIAPEGRMGHVMCYDSNSAQIILFGGAGGSTYPPNTYFNDTWIYDFQSDTWIQQTPLFFPEERSGHSMVYDSNSGQVILFGGSNSTHYFNDTWLYNPYTNIWTQQFPSTAPQERNRAEMVFESKTGQMILYGGANDSDYFNDTWIYHLDTNTWIQQQPLIAPPGRAGFSMIYDPITAQVVLFGGVESSDKFNDSWVYNYQTNNWVLVNPLIAPSVRYTHSMVYHTEYNTIILYGGAFGSTFYNETWIYPGRSYFKTGEFQSRTIYFDNIYDIQGKILYDPSSQPRGTELEWQIGLSNTTNEVDFQYIDVDNSSDFSFQGIAHYLRYRVIFKLGTNQHLSPVLKTISIHCILEKPKPNVEITNPQDFDTVNGTVTISVITGSPNGIEKVTFYVDGILVASDHSSPYTCIWNSTKSKNGQVSVIAIAVSFLGRENADSISIIINNPIQSGSVQSNGSSFPSIFTILISVTIIIAFMRKRS